MKLGAILMVLLLAAGCAHTNGELNVHFLPPDIQGGLVLVEFGLSPRVPADTKVPFDTTSLISRN